MFCEGFVPHAGCFLSCAVVCKCPIFYLKWRNMKENSIEEEEPEKKSSKKEKKENKKKKFLPITLTVTLTFLHFL